MPTCGCIAEQPGLCGKRTSAPPRKAAARVAAGFAVRDLGMLRK
jgi:hypothetical protein